MKIFLVYLVINSPQNTGYNYGLGYIASVLKEQGHSVDYIVLKNEKDILGLYGKIKQKKPKIIGFSATTAQFVYLKDIAKRTKEISDSFIVCGGIHPTLKPECILEIPDLDAIVRGEGEFPMFEFTKALENSENYHKIKNFWFKEKDRIIKNELRTFIENLDELPFPDKSSLDYQQLIDQSGGENRFIFSRGCTFECTYCSNKALGDLYEGTYFGQRSPQKAIEEIGLDAEKYKFRRIIFDDDIISLNKRWFYEFFTLYKKSFSYPFQCNLRVGTVDSDMIGLLKEAGAYRIMIGVEHGSEEFRKTILNRNMSNKEIIDTFKLCRQHNVRGCGQIMVGFPFENKKLFLDTVEFCRKFSTKEINVISIFYPYPGTGLGKLCEKNNWLPNKKYYKEREEAIISYPGFRKEEIQLCADVFYILLRFRFIPLKMPLNLVLYLYNFVKQIKTFTSLFLLYLRKWGKLMPWQREM